MSPAIERWMYVRELPTIQTVSGFHAPRHVHLRVPPTRDSGPVAFCGDNLLVVATGIARYSGLVPAGGPGDRPFWTITSSVKNASLGLKPCDVS